MNAAKMDERPWKLGDDLYPEDDLLDGVTFKELIETLQANCEYIDAKAIHRELERILEIRKQDMIYLLANNIDEIINAAKGGRNA